MPYQQLGTFQRTGQQVNQQRLRELVEERVQPLLETHITPQWAGLIFQVPLRTESSLDPVVRYHHFSSWGRAIENARANSVNLEAFVLLLATGDTSLTEVSHAVYLLLKPKKMSPSSTPRQSGISQ
eukprot:9219149-Ditylum_brightwellii.AAC.1